MDQTEIVEIDADVLDCTQVTPLVGDYDLNAEGRFLSKILRHDPDLVGVSLTDDGWVEISQLLTKLQLKSSDWSVDLLNLIVSSDEKKRFAISNDGKLIRANQGHTVSNHPTFRSASPPDLLFHRTTIIGYLGIVQLGKIDPRGRHHVHLSAHRPPSNQFREQSLTLSVDAGQMVGVGFKFYLTPNDVWLTDTVPTKFISITD